MYFGRTWDDWIEEYHQSHQDKRNQLCHLIGIPLVVVSIILLLVGIFLKPILAWGIGLFVIGWFFQFLGHYFESKPPEFLRDWRFLFVGLRWWLQVVRRKVKDKSH